MSKTRGKWINQVRTSVLNFWNICFILIRYVRPLEGIEPGPTVDAKWERDHNYQSG